METGKGRGAVRWLTISCMLCLACTGCATRLADAHRQLLTGAGEFRSGPSDASHPDSRRGSTKLGYRVGFPDVLEVRVGPRPEFDGQFALDTEGKIPLGDYGHLRVDGYRPDEIARKIARETGTPNDQVAVRVVEHRSQFVLVVGEVAGAQRPVSYQGPEPVIDVLRRAGGITPEAAPDEIYLVRSHFDGNQKSEVFHVDLPAVLLDRNDETNVPVQPFDQIYVGKSRRAKIEETLPGWILPIFRTCCGANQLVVRESTVEPRVRPAARRPESSAKRGTHRSSAVPSSVPLAETGPLR